jgi:type I restriction enzyme M protein
MEIQLRNNNREIYAPLKDKWLMATPEEVVRQGFICYLVNEYGYTLGQMEQELRVSNAQRGQGSARADIVIWRNEQERQERKNAFIVVECKAEKVTVRKEDYFQGSNYATWARAKFFITTNEKETKFFRVLEEKLPLDIEEIIDVPKAKDVNNEKEIARLYAQLKTFERDEFQKLLFACHDVIRNNDKLSPEMAFDEISKVLFMKIRQERTQNGVFSKERFLQLKKTQEDYETQIVGKKSDKPFYQHLFEQTKDTFAKDEIFVPTDTLRIREASFLQIVEKLQRYNLSDTSDDVKGIAFEEFLGKTFRGDLGQFFTPRTLVDFMIGLLDIQEGELVCDPCCGTGGFLIKSFEYIREKIEQDIQQTKERFRQELLPENFDALPEKEQQDLMGQLQKLFNELNNELETNAKGSRLHHLSYNCIFGTDAEPRSARTAKMNMIMHGDGHGGVHHHDGLLNVNGIFENRFDVIVTNPPFGASVSKDLFVKESELQPKEHYIKRYGKEYTQAYEAMLERYDALYYNREKNNQNKDNDGVSLLSFFETGSMSGLTEVLFMERCLNLLRKGGRMGIVLPEGFLNGANLQKVRDFVEGRAKLLAVVSIPQDVFISAGATVKSSLVFLKKFTEEEEQQYAQITERVTLETKTRYQPTIDEHAQAHEATEKELNKLKKDLQNLKKTKLPKADKDQQTQVLNQQIKAKQLAYKAEKQAFDAWKKETEAQMNTEIKAEIKNRFSYSFPIVQAEKAGISSTGQKIESDLPAVRTEFATYKQQAQLWQSKAIQYTYTLTTEKSLQRHHQEILNF